MKKTLIALALANLVLVGCGSDSDSKSPTPTPNPEPETVAIGDATSINLGTPAFDDATGEVTFTLTTDAGEAITGLETFGLRYVAMEAKDEWKHMTDKMGLASHEAFILDCDAELCDVTVTPGDDGSYSLMPKSYEWQGTPDSVRVWLHVATETVVKEPIWLEAPAS